MKIKVFHISGLFCFNRKLYHMKQKTLREDAHLREAEICRRRPRSVRECALAHSFDRKVGKKMERIHVKVPGEQPQDREYMKQALALAEKGHGWVNPNPMVGAVLVKDGRIIGEGYHTRYGQLHAEREAFKNAAERGEETAGADLYVTLEPCQMCAGAIVQARIPRVVIGCRNPKAGCAGSILNLLNVPAFNHQVELTKGILQEECSTLLKEFFRKLRKIKVQKV